MGKTNDRFTISHFECSAQECLDLRAAALWIWKCLENLAAVFCEYYCCRPICNMPEGTIEKLTKYRRATSEQESQEQWEDVQRQFHEAMAYFPEYAKLIDTCPACAVAESFSCFPLIVRHSPRSPVATMKMNAVDCYPDVVFCGGVQQASLPCVVIETMITDFETQTEERLRESALLALDASDLPPMPPSELEKIKKKLIPGQRIVRALNRLCNYAPTEEELKKRDLKEHLASAIVSVSALKELIRIHYYYPDAIDEGRAQALHEELVQFLEVAMADAGFMPAKVEYTRPELGDYSAVTSLGFMFGLLVIQYPQMGSGDRSPEHKEKAFNETMRECAEQVPGRLRDIVVELKHAQMYRCLIPRPVDDPSFAENGRFVQMIDRYWSLCKKVITYQLDAGIYAPDAILPLMSNLRERVEACFVKLGSLDSVAEAQQAFSALIDTCTSPDWDDFQAAPEWTREMIHKIDAFLASANIVVRRLEYPLIPEERMFIEHSNREIDEFHAFISKKWKAMLADAETMGKQVARKTDVTIPGPAEEHPKDKRIFLKQGKTWLVVYDGVPKNIADSVGMDYIRRLLQNPGPETHAAALRGGVADEDGTPILGSAGETLDPQALREYKVRMSEIDEDLTEAEANNDLARKERLKEERETLNDEIARSTGLHGKSRKASNDRERARQSVSTAIHRALKAIKKEHEPLWQHLNNSLKIGEFLSYQPDQPTSWIT